MQPINPALSRPHYNSAPQAVNVDAPALNAPVLVTRFTDAISFEFLPESEIDREIRSNHNIKPDPRDFPPYYRLDKGIWQGEKSLSEIGAYIEANPAIQRVQFRNAAIEVPDHWRKVYDQDGFWFGTYKVR